MAKWAVTLGTALLAEAAGHWLSLTWGFMILVFAFIYTGVGMAAATAKSASTEARVNALVPALGSATNTANSAQSTANTANSTANTANSTANTVNSRTSGLSLFQGFPGAYPAVGSPSNSGLGTYCNEICDLLHNAGIF